MGTQEKPQFSVVLYPQQIEPFTEGRHNSPHFVGVWFLLFFSGTYFSFKILIYGKLEWKDCSNPYGEWF